MPRPHKPWFRKQTKQWYVEIDGKQHPLGPDKDEAERKFHELMAKRPNLSDDHVATILDRFLDWTQAHRSQRTYKWYKDLLQSFATEHPNLRIEKAKPHHLENWANKGKGKRAKITALKRAMNWATKRGEIQANPFSSVERPEVGRREELITKEDYDLLISKIRDKQFRDLVEFSWETGCRPQEAKQLETRHVDFDNEVCVFPKEESKGKKRPRVIYLTPRAIEIIKENLPASGIVFLNARGKPWTTSAVKCRFARLEEKLGKRYCHYLLRHAWTTRKIAAGVDSHVVATLAGHRDTRMIDLHYSKVSKQHEFLLKQAKREDVSDEEEPSVAPSSDTDTTQDTPQDALVTHG